MTSSCQLPVIPSHNSLIWAVRLGAMTPGRLAREWGISFYEAADRLRRAAKQGAITCVRRGSPGNGEESVYWVPVAEDEPELTWNDWNKP